MLDCPPRQRCWRMRVILATVVVLVCGGAPPWPVAGGRVGRGVSDVGRGGGWNSEVGVLGEDGDSKDEDFQGDGERRLASAVERCRGSNPSVSLPLTLHTLPPTSLARCNDNSLAGYYLRRGLNSRLWIVFLEGGGYCFDQKSCLQRWHHQRSLMTSREWTSTKQVGGILSPHPEENPHWWRANHVFVPYCSSDSWSGTRASEDSSEDFAFLGSVIVEEVVASLLALNLTHGHKLILAGSSAGGVGVLVNVDRVAHQLSQLGIRAEVRAVSDSGWFLDNKPFVPLQCLDAHSCPPVEAIRRGQELWRGRIPESCRVVYPHHPWFCYFGYRLYPTMKSPLFVFQWVFDKAQMSADNVGEPNSKEQWDYIFIIGERLRKTFDNVTALFAPSCISHTVLTKRTWAGIKIDEVSLPQALYCWSTTPPSALLTRSSTGEVGDHQGSNRRNSSPSQSRSRHQRPRRQRTGRLGERERNDSRSRDRKRNSSDGERQRHGRRKRKKNSKKGRVIVNESDGGVVQSSQLVLIGDGEETREDSDDGNVQIASVDRTTDDGNIAAPKLVRNSTDIKNSDDEGRENRPKVLSGEMLADSPTNSIQISLNPVSTYLVESNAINDPTQENTELRLQRQRSRGERVDRRRSRKERQNRTRKETRRKRRKRKKSKKDGRRRNRKRDRRRQGRRRKQRRRKEEKDGAAGGEGSAAEGEEVGFDGVRTARSLFLLHSKQPSSPPPIALSTLPASPPTISSSSSSSFPSTTVHQSSLLSTPVPHPPPSQTTQSGLGEEKDGDLDGFAHDEICSSIHDLHLMDRCTWPHCNYVCPKLLNPYTGEEMNSIELLKSFGLDMESVAKAMDIDIHTLNSMGNDELLHILTQ